MTNLFTSMNNKTGIAFAPQRVEKAIEAAKTYSPEVLCDSTSLNSIKEQYVDDDLAGLGTLPPPASLKEGVQMMDKTLAGQDLSKLTDKLSERIGFERAGTRLYEAAIAKCKLLEELPNGPSVSDLEEIRDDELEHFHMLTEAVNDLGGDPTIVSPAADASAIASSGILKVIADTRTTVVQTLDALLVAELNDNDSWRLLIDLCQKLTLDDLASKFEDALKSESEHLDKVRNWLNQAVLS